MKLATRNTDVLRGGLAENAESSFSIAVNGKAFRVLSDTLYQDKPGSIVRELSCNAYDSHVQAGKREVPFEIHLPNMFEPWFHVRDFGIGLSDDDVRSIYTRYFESTKANSNDVIGAFGLGSKTPFSYTDSFTVVSIFNGVKRSYSAFIAESGVPSIVILNTEPTTESNGVEVRMAVEKKDWSVFRNKVRDQLRYFTVKPTIMNGEPISWENPTPQYDTPNATLFASNSYNGSTTAIQGQVGYVLNENVISEKLNPQDREFFRLLNQSSAILKFNIGDIGVTASREGVSYDAKTLNAIVQKIRKVRGEVLEIVKQEIAAIPTAWEKAAYLNSSSRTRELAVAAGVAINGFKKDGHSFGFHIGDFNNYEVDVDGKKVPHTFYSVKGFECRDPHRRTANNGARAFQTKPGDFVAAEKRLTIIIDDKPKRVGPRIKHFVTNKNANVIVFSGMMGHVLGMADATRISDGLGKVPVIFASTLADPPKPVRGSNNTGYTQPIAYYCNSRDYTNARDWERVFESEDLEDGGIYVEVTNGTVVADAEDIQMLKALRDYNVSFNLYGFATRRLAKIAEDKDNWTPLKDFVKSEREKVKALNLHVKYANDRFIRSAVIGMFTNNSILEALSAKASDINGALGFLLRAYKNSDAKADNDLESLKLIMTGKRYGEFKPDPKVEKKINALVKRCRGKYPLIMDGHTGYGRVNLSGDFVKHAIRYIELVNAGGGV